MTASFTPPGAAEFPNDNPALHRGVRWVCPTGRGPARALWRALSDSTLPSSASEEPAREAPSKPSPAPTKPMRVDRRCDGPLELDLDRIVIPHRVEDVPPPPDFIYTPFVSSRAAEAPAPSPRPFQPRPCRVVVARPARPRAPRGWRIDVEPPAPAEPAPELQAASA